MTEALNTIREWKAKGYSLRTPPLVLCGYDPAGDGSDRDALVMIAREEHQKGEPWDPDFAVMTMFRLLMAHRMRPDLEFPDKLAMLLRLHRQLRSWRNLGRCARHIFTVETNGVGYAMASSLGKSISDYVVPYVTVGNASEDPFREKKVSMPRLASLDNLRVLLETHCFKVAKDAPGRKEFSAEMSSFVWKGRGRPEAIEGQHDDLVMAAAGACWVGTKVLPPMLKQQKVTPYGLH